MIDFFAAMIHNLRREPDQALAYADRAAVLSQEQGFEYFEAGSLVELGRAMALKNCTTGGIEKIREGLALHESIGGRLERPYYLSALGECLARANRPDEALAVVQEGINLSRRTASQFHEPDLLCLKAELLARQSAPELEAAEACVCQALQMTRESGAKSLELRAAVILCRLQRRGGRQEARETLSTVTEWFTEGFDTTDLKEARSLMKSLFGG